VARLEAGTEELEATAAGADEELAAKDDELVATWLALEDGVTDRVCVCVLLDEELD